MVSRPTADPVTMGIAIDSTALHVAAWRACHDVVKELIACGTPVDALDGRGRTALQLAIKAFVSIRSGRNGESRIR